MAWYDSDLVVTIIDETFPLALPGLSMPIILDIAPAGSKPDEVVTYSSITGVGVDHDPETPAYGMANRILSQEPHVSQMQIFNFDRQNYKKASLKTGTTNDDSGLIWSAQDYGADGETISVTMTAGQALAVAVNSKAITVTFVADTTLASAVRTAVNGNAAAAALVLVGLDPANASPGTGSGKVVVKTLTLLDRDNTANSPVELTRALNKIWDLVQENDLPQPYFLLSPTRDYDDGTYVPGVTGDREELADAVASRLMYFCTGNRGTSLTDDGLESPATIHTLAQTMATDRTLLFWHNESEGLYPEAAIAGLWGAISPGGLTLRWKRLKGITASKGTDNDLAVLRGQAPGSPGAFTYAKAVGSPVLTGSWSSDGSFADWRRDKDWLRIRLQARILFALRNRPKLLGDARGTSILKAAINEIFHQAATMGIIGIDEDGHELFDTRMPRLKDWPVLDRAMRRLTGLDAVITPAGAIEEVVLPVYATFDELSTFQATPGF